MGDVEFAVRSGVGMAALVMPLVFMVTASRPFRYFLSTQTTLTISLPLVAYWMATRA